MSAVCYIPSSYQSSWDWKNDQKTQEGKVFNVAKWNFGIAFRCLLKFFFIFFNKKNYENNISQLSIREM
jgi:hypothetical protein